ncbi:MAG TPA: hypothetical protein DG753_09380 [Clostridium sp.]|nr:hypothetical protein [Clostridium sp.]
MKINKKTLYIVFGCFIFLCSVIGGGIYLNKTSNRNILIKNIYKTSEYGESFNEEFLKNYNLKNIDKLNQDKSIPAEDYFFIAYEYCELDNEWEKGIKYAMDFKSRKGTFTNRYIELYNDYLINYYYIVIKNDNNALQKIDNTFKNVTFKDWNESTDLLITELSLLTNCGENDYVINKLENILKNEEQLDLEPLVGIKDKLTSLYTQKGYHYARVLELCVEIDSILNTYSIRDEEFYKSKSLYNQASIYSLLEEDNMAKELYMKTLDVNTENEKLNINIKAVSLNRLITMYLSNGKIDLAKDLLNKYEEIYNGSDEYKSDVLYCLSMGQYYMEKYEREGKNKDNLNESDYYLKTSVNNYNKYLGNSIVNLELYQSMYSLYLEYLKGNVDYSLNKYNKLLETVDNITMRRLILSKMYNIYYDQGMYKKAIECHKQITKIKDEACLLIKKDYSTYHVEKYRNDIKIRKLDEMKFRAYINLVIVIFIVGIIVIFALLRHKKLRKRNKIDEMSEINNRSYFDKQYRKMLKEKKDFYIYMFDIDDFKKINDTYGHLIGDKVIKMVAKTGKEVIDNNGCLFRYGGEEFVAIVDHLDRNKVISIAEDIRKRIEDLTWDNDMKITISMGIADSAIEKERVLEVADNRLYISKATGKNKFTFK